MALAAAPKFPLVTRLVVAVVVEMTTGPVVTIVGSELRSTIGPSDATLSWPNSDVSVKVVNVALLLVAVALIVMSVDRVTANVVLKFAFPLPLGVTLTKPK